MHSTTLAEPPRSPIWSFALYGLAALLTAGALALLIFWFTSNPTFPLRYDGLVKLSEWVAGERIPEALWHNNSASWGQALGLYLDAYFGPFGLWSHLIGYGLTAFFFATMLRLFSQSLGTPQGAALTALMLFAWMQWFNGSQVYWFYWRISETGLQLGALAIGIWMIQSWPRSSWGRKAVQLVALFLCSQVHIGYLAPPILFVALILRSENGGQRALAAALLPLYLLYLVFVDGVLLTFYDSFQSMGDSGAGPSSWDYLKSIVTLSTAILERALSMTPLHGGAFGLQLLTFAAMLLCLLVASLRALLRADAEATIYCFVVSSQLITVALITLGRYEIYSDTLQEVNRYASYSLLIVGFTLWYGLRLLPFKPLAFGAPLLLGALFAANVPQTLEQMSQQQSSARGMANYYYFSALGPRLLPQEQPTPKSNASAAETLHQAVTWRFKTAFFGSLDHLLTHEVAQFGTSGWRWLQQADGQVALAPIPLCEGRFDSQPRGDDRILFSYHRKDFTDVEFGLVTDAEGKPLGFGRPIPGDNPRVHITLLDRSKAAAMILLGEEKGEAIPLCRAEIVWP